jgi:hypothetical protein
MLPVDPFEMSDDIVTVGEPPAVEFGIEQDRNATLTRPFIQFISISVFVSDDGFVVV